MSEHVIASADELSDGERLITQVQGREIAVFRVDGEYYAYTNWCAHQSGPACEGPIAGTAEAEYDRETMETNNTWNPERKFVACPWHGWEFDVTTGECISNREYELPAHPISVKNGDLVVSL